MATEIESTMMNYQTRRVNDSNQSRIDDENHRKQRVTKSQSKDSKIRGRSSNVKEIQEMENNLHWKGKMFDLRTRTALELRPREWRSIEYAKRWNERLHRKVTKINIWPQLTQTKKEYYIGNMHPHYLWPIRMCDTRNIGAHTNDRCPKDDNASGTYSMETAPCSNMEDTGEWTMEPSV